MQKNILRKSLEISGALNDEGIFTGHASVFGVVDETGDVIETGAFADTLAMGEASNGVMIFGQHEDYRPPIGKSIELREDQTGLFVRGKISATEEGLTYRQLVKDGVLTKMSIGYANAEEARQYYPPSDVIVDAPDNVREGWGYLPDAAQPFVKPTPPEGWQYDDDTGTFTPIPGWEPPPTLEERLADAEAALADLGIEPEEVETDV